ncbi:hypothetical protein CHU98_g7296, partial [Xylaria longipes]
MNALVFIRTQHSAEPPAQTLKTRGRTPPIIHESLQLSYLYLWQAMASPLFVLDVKEKDTTEAKAPSFPRVGSGTSGFPEHKKRGKVSAFKQKRQGLQSDDQKPKVFLSSSDQPLSPSNHGPRNAPLGESIKANEKSNIDRENRQRLASMSPQEIEQARQDLFSGLDPSILEMLLKRANLDESANTLPLDQPQPTPEATSSGGGQADTVPGIRIEDTSIGTRSSAVPDTHPTQPNATSANNTPTNTRPQPSVSEETDECDSPRNQTTNPENHTLVDDDSAPAIPPQEHIIDPSLSSEADGAHHWPRAPQPADLDPSDPNFLQNLHEKYFPSLPADPSKLAWMAPIPTPNSAADRDSPYYPGQ